jgi:hypothetical protein
MLVNMSVPACWPLDGLPGEFYTMSALNIGAKAPYSRAREY